MSNYWEKRAARQMHSQMQKAEDYMSEIAEYYMAASLDLQDKAKDILRRFRLKHNLSEYEAEQILANIDPADIKGIVERPRRAHSSGGSRKDPEPSEHIQPGEKDHSEPCRPSSAGSQIPVKEVGPVFMVSHGF